MLVTATGTRKGAIEAEAATAPKGRRAQEPDAAASLPTGMRSVLELQRLAGNAAVARMLVQRQTTSFPEDAEERLNPAGGKSSGGKEDLQAQRLCVTYGAARHRSPVQRTASSYAIVQRVGGATVGRLCIRSNVAGGGLTDGHAWLSYTPTGGMETTYGTWGNVDPVGLHRDREVGQRYAAERCVDVDAPDVGNLNTFAASNNTWGYLNNCSSFAARGWQAVTGEALSYTTWGIPNPSALGTGINAANAAGAAAPGPAPAVGGSSL